jgi:hypothetical protein
MSITDLSKRATDEAAYVLAGDGSTRRNFLIRIALFGTALAAAPVRFLLEPGNAFAVNCPQPQGCGSGACTDGFSAFCCTIDGHSNNCPGGTSPGGWWHACVPTNYCSSGTRYYIDCVGNCGTTCANCHCANWSCGNRRVCCNHGYTNCGGSGSAYLRCRIVRCVNPCNLFGGCSCTSAEKDARTCSHGSGACVAAPGTSCQSLSCSA